MKEFVKKYTRTLLVAFLALGMVANCNPFASDDDDDNNALLLGALLLSQSNAPVVAKANLIVKIKKADGTRFADSVMATISGGPTANSGSAARDFSTDEDGKTDDGNLNYTLDLTSFAGLVRFTVTDKREGTAGDNPDQFTVPVGDFTVKYVINSEGDGKVESVEIESANGLTASDVQITAVTILGRYPTFTKSEGEKVCDGDKLTGSPTPLSGTISTAQNWSGGYILQGTVIVNAPITIQPGTVIFGSRGSSLFVLGNNKITSKGTKENPICFTSSQQLGSRFPGDWGGIVTVGDHGSTRASTTEGTTPQPYGNNSSSATDRDKAANVEMEYTIIEFGGNEVAPGDELNNLSMYATGSVLTHVQAHRGLDDQFEQWGGKLTWNKMIATGGLDDDYDLDEGVRGTITNAIGYKYPVACGGSPSTDPHGLEWDGTHNNGTDPCPAAYGCTQITLDRFTMVGANITSGEQARLRERVQATLSNGVFYGFGTGIRPANTSVTSGSATTVTLTNVKSDKAMHNTGGTTGLVDGTFDSTASGIVSDASIPTNCGFTDTKPDFTLKAEATTLGATSNGAGKYWETWAVFRGR